MDIYKQKFTSLQRSILRFLFIHAGKTFTMRAIALTLDVSSTAIAKSLPGLNDLIIVNKDPQSKRLSITLNRENQEVYTLKRIDNILLLYESGVVSYLTKIFPSSTIVVFGSYALGEDSYNSDIDLVIIGKKEQEISLTKFEKILNREINLQFYPLISSIHKELLTNVYNGLVLEGRL